MANPVSLPWGDINVMVLTDHHSWMASHAPEEPHLDLDYGLLVSLHRVLSSYSKIENKTLFFVMNGDFVDGTGLTTHPPDRLVELLKCAPVFDAVNVGNHELYRNDTVQSIVQNYIPFLEGKYLTSNVLLTNTQEPMGSRYRVLKSSRTGVQVLTFGFLYNFRDHSSMTIVEKVEGVVKSQWFLDALQNEKYDAIMVLAHMDLRDPLVYVILDAVRKVAGPTMPVQFITGHTHYRGFHVLDKASASFEAGRYLDTVGFASFPKKTTSARNMTSAFRSVSLDANKQVLNHVLNYPSNREFTYESHGHACGKMIQEARTELGLVDVVGCAPERLYLEHALNESQSLWGFYRDHIVNGFLFGEILTENQFQRVYFHNQGGFRYDLVNGTITKDRVIAVSAFGDEIFEVANNLTATQMLDILGHEPNTDIDPTARWGSKLPGTIVNVDAFPDGKLYELYAVSFELEKWTRRVANVTGRNPDPRAVMTTTDLWTQYVSQHMAECPQSDEPANDQHLLLVLLVAIAAVLGGLCSWIMIRQRNRFVHSNGDAIMKIVPETDSQDSDDDNDGELI